jgi:protein-S-isoprenylcysteine O-methyltransferase Ste14
VSPKWWKGERGEWFVIAQFALIALVFFGPRQWFGWPDSSLPLPGARLVIGALLLASGCALMLAAVLKLGRNLTPLPAPKEGATLVQGGAYRIVRHPIYSAILAACLGLALLKGSVTALICVAALAMVLDAKSRREERWLTARHREYANYQRQVRRFLPFIY